ncbi:putative cytochrome P450 [Hibiscus syriacus]|uniref:Cytochrome P450 n=1 Tax=Hibiscus syriacus TaxID=106335 RepID=A0A6A3AJ76_HIBSY|nr:putative cytochrome P450 [Hibiscus syriacus]
MKATKDGTLVNMIDWWDKHWEYVISKTCPFVNMEAHSVDLIKFNVSGVETNGVVECDGVLFKTALEVIKKQKRAAGDDVFLAKKSMFQTLAATASPARDNDPAAALASLRREFGELGGVIMSIDSSATFTVMELDTMRRMFTDELGLDRDFFIYSRHFNPTILNLSRQLAALEGTEAAYCTASGWAVYLNDDRTGVSTISIRKLSLQLRRDDGQIRRLKCRLGPQSLLRPLAKTGHFHDGRRCLIGGQRAFGSGEGVLVSLETHAFLMVALV